MKEPFLKQFKILSHFGSFLHLSSLCSSSQYFGIVEVLFRIPTCEILLWVKWNVFAVLCNMQLNPLDKVKPSHSGFILQRYFSSVHYDMFTRIFIFLWHFFNSSKWCPSFRWSLSPNSAWNRMETITIRRTHATLERVS